MRNVTRRRTTDGPADKDLWETNSSSGPRRRGDERDETGISKGMAMKPSSCWRTFFFNFSFSQGDMCLARLGVELEKMTRSP